MTTVASQECRCTQNTSPTEAQRGWHPCVVDHIPSWMATSAKGRECDNEGFGQEADNDEVYKQQSSQSMFTKYIVHAHE
jgi:hypothetical protein